MISRVKGPLKKYDFQDACNETYKSGTQIIYGTFRSGAGEETSRTYNRETRIWKGGWDSLQHIQFYGFNWISVQGKDTVCVVTQDKVGNGLLSELSHHLEGGNPAFGKDSFIRLPTRSFSKMGPFAVVSVVLSWDEFNAEHCVMASTAETEAVTLLAQQIDNVSCFTYAVTVKTAIDAFVCLAQKDLNMEKIKAHIYILKRGRGRSPVATGVLTYEDIMKLMVKQKLPKYLITDGYQRKKSAIKRNKKHRKGKNAWI